jgi:hypothetical protein
VALLNDISPFVYLEFPSGGGDNFLQGFGDIMAHSDSTAKAQMEALSASINSHISVFENRYADFPFGTLKSGPGKNE